MQDPIPSDVVILVSANAEWRTIEAIFLDAVFHRSAMGAWFTARLGDASHEVLLFHAGWGKIAAAASTQFVIHHCRPKLLVNLGTCGGFDGEVQPGEVILAERTIVYDIYEQMGDHDEHVAHYATELDLSWLVLPHPRQVRLAPVVSADRDLFAADIPRLKRDFGAIVADWESASIAWVAHRHQVRTLILRGVSDLVGQSGGQAYDGNLHVFEQNTQTIMRRLIEDLPAWLDRSMG